MGGMIWDMSDCQVECIFDFKGKETVQAKDLLGVKQHSRLQREGALKNKENGGSIDELCLGMGRGTQGWTSFWDTIKQ